jgi:hypothetical protein
MRKILNIPAIDLILKVFRYLKRQIEKYGSEHGAAKSEERTANASCAGLRSLTFKRKICQHRNLTALSLSWPDKPHSPAFMFDSHNAFLLK